MKKLLSRVVMLWLCFAAAVLAAPLRLSYSVVGPTVAGIWMAHETSTFKKYGLDVQLIYIPSSGMNIQALLGGSLDASNEKKKLIAKNAKYAKNKISKHET